MTDILWVNNKYDWPILILAPAAPAKGKKKGLAAKIAEREAKEKAARQKQQEVSELTPAQRAVKIEEDELLGAAEMLAIDIKDPDS